MKKIFILLVVLMAVCTLAFAGGRASASGSAQGPLEIRITYPDNATLPFRNDWLTVRRAEEMFNVKITWDIIPIADYGTVVSLALNSGVNTPDVILYQSIAGENIALAQNGAIVPISDYSAWTPNWNARVQEFGLRAEVDRQRLSDGKLYSLPRLYDVPFYDGGLILREDLLARYGMSAPRTFDDLYNFLRRYKQENPSSYPLTILAGPRVLYRMTQPSWGISVHSNGAGGSRVLSWDYSREQFFAAIISDQYRDYMRFFHRLYAEGLLDPEMADPIDGDVWTRKLATGNAIATYAYYDQIGGVEAATTIPGFKLNMYPPLAGPAGAHHQQKDSLGSGIIFPIATSRRADFERIVRTVDEMFFSNEAAVLWCLGVEGETFTVQGGQRVFNTRLTTSPDGIYKAGQLLYGMGADPLQMVWRNAWEMTKYDDNYARINAEVAAMPNAIQAIPPIPKFNDVQAERATALMGAIFESFVRWDDWFLTGARSLETDWNTYVQEMNSRGIMELVNLYNSNL